MKRDQALDSPWAAQAFELCEAANPGPDLTPLAVGKDLPDVDLDALCDAVMGKLISDPSKETGLIIASTPRKNGT